MDFFLLPYLPHFGTFVHMGIYTCHLVLSVKSMQKLPLIQSTLEMHPEFPRVLILKYRHKGRNIIICMHLHILLLSFLFCILLISLLKPLKLLTANQLTVSTLKIYHKATKGCSAAHTLPHTCSEAMAKYFCTSLSTESSNAPVMANNQILAVSHFSCEYCIAQLEFAFAFKLCSLNQRQSDKNGTDSSQSLWELKQIQQWRWKLSTSERNRSGKEPCIFSARFWRCSMRMLLCGHQH